MSRYGGHLGNWNGAMALPYSGPSWMGAAPLYAQPYGSGMGYYAGFGGLPSLDSLRCLTPELPHPADTPILPALAAVVAVNLAVSMPISIPPRFENRLLGYAASNRADGAILRIGYARCPRYRSGGPILRLQPHAKAMTLDKNVFVDGALDISTYIHEMVHVAQDKVLGVGPFLLSYFGISAATILSRWIRGVPTNPMRSSPHENQAYELTSRFMTWVASNP